MTLFNLDREQEEFDWTWIDKRRDGRLTATEVLTHAPRAWKEWVKYGETRMERCRRKIARNRVVKVAEQLDYPSEEKDLVNQIVAHFSPDRHAFEGLASLVAKLVIGERCLRGWVTKRSGDGGIDFVCRLDLGSDFSRSSITVLGQAKCLQIKRSVSGHDLARVVARLQRGWIGVFVTTGVFSEAAQIELNQDKYPMILINGKRLATELRRLINREGVNLNMLLEREKQWYEANMKPLDPARIRDVLGSGTPLGEVD